MFCNLRMAFSNPSGGVNNFEHKVWNPRKLGIFINIQVIKVLGTFTPNFKQVGIKNLKLGMEELDYSHKLNYNKHG